MGEPKRRARIVLEIERTWAGSDESMAKSIKEMYLEPHGFKIKKIEVGMSDKDAKILAILNALNRVIKRNIPTGDDMIPIIDQMIAQLGQIMTLVE